MRRPFHSLGHPLSAEDLRTYSAEIEALQGNILKSHGRHATLSVLLTFKEGHVDQVRDFVRNIPVTSAAEQRRQADAFIHTGRSELFVGFCLSAAGYRFLGCDLSDFSATFRGGMRGSGPRLKDPPVSRWEPRYREQLHAMMTLAHSESSVLTQILGTLQRQVEPFASMSWETGRRMRVGDQSVEHFGFVDGVSEPVFFVKDLPAEPLRRNWDPSAGPKLVLVKDPLGTSDMECGSYLVFRKLEQNVKGFRLRERALARELNLAADEAELAGAAIVGRFRDGTPVATAPRRSGRAANDFTYREDPAGNRCPLFAHVRKANPRGASAELHGDERAHRIARRGITYGASTLSAVDESRWPEHGVGLLFQCYQAGLANQFEFIQLQWANQADAPEAGGQKDTVIGQGGATHVQVPARWGEPDRVPFDFGEFVRLLGGEYFFTPSIPVLRRI